MTITIKPKNKKEYSKIKRILDAVEIDFVEEAENDFSNEISDAEKESVKRGLEDAKKGNFKPHSEARKLYEKWL